MDRALALKQDLTPLSAMGRLEPGTWGGDFLERFAPDDEGFVVLQHRTSAFADTRLELLLRANRIRAVVIAGVETHGGVVSTAQAASDRDYEVIVARECVATTDAASHLHAASLEIIERSAGRVLPLANVLAAWSAG
jgi:nicotinamidase-related amidase